MTSSRPRVPAKRPGYFVQGGSPSLKFVKLSDNPKGVNEPNPNVHLGDSSWVKYRLPTGIILGLVEPLKPLAGTTVPGGGADGKKRNNPTTIRLSIWI